MATINVVGGFMVNNRMLEMIAGKRGSDIMVDSVIWDIGYLKLQRYSTRHKEAIKPQDGAARKSTGSIRDVPSCGGHHGN